ncbi:MAG: thiamine-phosphate kinase [Alistipes senegalensis]|nr:thiamine-phosphate kinase [Bacteroides cellulosilyticus]MCM1351633.1 thiamine-phosphate kinase [Alistipes senegalensis]
MTEFDFIRRIAARFAALPANGFEGIGDDCAVLPVGGGEVLLFTADLLTEGVHFLRAATSARELGRKSLAVNLSDVAAMGGRPVATLLSLSLPADATGDWADEFMEGYREMSERFGVALVGGDTTRSESGVVINVTAIGRADTAHIKRRSDARAGDTVFVAGELGASGAGLRDILASRCDTLLAAAHRNPEPQVDEGVWLGGRPEVHAMMDLSDGLASDIGHILERSECGAVLDTERIPVAAGADLRQAVCGGEDYKLLFTADATAAERLANDFRQEFGTPLYPIGCITKRPGLVWQEHGRPVVPDWQGFRHFD